MSRIHFDPDGGHRNGLNSGCHIVTQSGLDAARTMRRCRTHLVSKQDHDGVASSSRRSVFHREGIIVIPDDVKVDIGLCRSNHPRSALNANTDVT